MFTELCRCHSPMTKRHSEVLIVAATFPPTCNLQTFRTQSEPYKCTTRCCAQCCSGELVGGGGGGSAIFARHQEGVMKPSSSRGFTQTGNGPDTFVCTCSETLLAPFNGPLVCHHSTDLVCHSTHVVVKLMVSLQLEIRAIYAQHDSRCTTRKFDISLTHARTHARTADSRGWGRPRRRGCVAVEARARCSAGRGEGGAAQPADSTGSVWRADSGGDRA